jgi:hypothetical protein
VIDLQAFGEKSVLRGDHVLIAIARETGPQAVAGLARSAVTDAVRQDEIVAVGVEGLPCAKQLPRELGPQELLTATRGAMEDQHRIAHGTLTVALRRSQRSVVDAQLGKGLAG